MIRHVALFRWAAGASQDQIDAVSHSLSQLPALIPELRDYRLGSDLQQVNGNWDYAVVADFESVEDWATYTGHPEHQRVLAELIRPILADRAAVQFTSWTPD